MLCTVAFYAILHEHCFCCTCIAITYCGIFLEFQHVAFLCSTNICSMFFHTLEAGIIRYVSSAYFTWNSTLGWITDFLSGGHTQRVLLDGLFPATSPVTSGVPQGTVLGPLLFLVYINDLPSRVCSTVRMFADNCLLYRTMKTVHDTNTLQSDLDSLQHWEKDWLMEFNPSKCEAITFTRKTRPVKAKYNLHGTTLETVTSAKYLGVHVSSKLTWNEHTDVTIKKASQTLNFVRSDIPVTFNWNLNWKDCFQ